MLNIQYIKSSTPRFFLKDPL